MQTKGLWPDDEALSARSDADVLTDAEDGARAHVDYQRDPIGWIERYLAVPRRRLVWSENVDYAWHEWDGTRDPLAAVLAAVADWKNCGVESGTTTGKTFLGACIVLWYLACFEDATVVTVAPKKDQLELHIWKEIGKLWPRFVRHFSEAELTSLRIRMRAGSDGWAAHGFVCGVGADEESANKARGFHAEHLLIVFEETPGIDAAIVKAFRDTCMAPHNTMLAFGNPDHQLDQLHRFCTSPSTVHVRISALDHPNVVCDDPSIVPGAASRPKIDERRAEDGGESRSFKAKVRGISPAEAAEALIKLEWLEGAAAKYDDPAKRAAMAAGKRALGVDPANSVNGDKAAVARGQGAVLYSVTSAPCPDSNELARDLYEEMREKSIEPAHVGVDPIGVGAGTVNTFDELTRSKSGPRGMVQRCNGSHAPMERASRAPDGTTREWIADANLFNNLRSQMWWQLREDLRLGRIAMAKDANLWRQLTTPLYSDDAGKVVVEAKERIKRRLGGYSPDEADAVVYWNWVRPRKAPPIDDDEPLNAFAPEVLKAQYEQSQRMTPRIPKKGRVRRAGMPIDDMYGAF